MVMFNSTTDYNLSKNAIKNAIQPKKHIFGKYHGLATCYFECNRNTPTMIRSSESLMLALCYSIKTQWTKVFVSF